MSYEYLMGLGTEATTSLPPLLPPLTPQQRRELTPEQRWERQQAHQAAYQARRNAARAIAQAMSNEELIRAINQQEIASYQRSQLPYDQQQEIEQTARMLKNAIRTEYNMRRYRGEIGPLPSVGIPEIDERRQRQANEEAIESFTRPFGLFGRVLDIPIRTYASVLGVRTTTQQAGGGLLPVIAIAGPLAGGYLAHRKTDGSLPWTAAGAVGGAVALPIVAAGVGLALFVVSGGGARY